MLTLVIGVGNAWRGDDAAGPAVAQRVHALDGGVEVREIVGDASELVEAWPRHEHVALVDAAKSCARPGTLHVFRAQQIALSRIDLQRLGAP